MNFNSIKTSHINADTAEQLITKRRKGTTAKPFLAIHGGLGDPKHSVIRFYAKTLQKLSEYYDLIAVDPLADEASAQERQLLIQEKLNIQYAQIISPEKYFVQLSKKKALSPDGIFILTPVMAHIKTLYLYFKALGTKLTNLKFFVEKPLCSLNELKTFKDKGVFAFLDNIIKKGNQVYAVDSSMQAHSLEHCIENNVLSRIGQIKRIKAIGLDHPVLVDKKHTHSFADNIASLNSRGLLNLRSSGGAGFAFDMGIHPLAAVSRLVAKHGIKLADAEIADKDVRLESIKNKDLDRSIGAETYLSAQTKIGDIDFLLEAGKASDLWDKRIEIYGSKGKIAIGLGTLQYKNYILLQEESSEPELIIFDSLNSGYQNCMNSIESILADNPDVTQSHTAIDSVGIMQDTLNFMYKLFKIEGKTSQQREQTILKVTDFHRPIFINQEYDFPRNLSEQIPGIKRAHF